MCHLEWDKQTILCALKSYAEKEMFRFEWDWLTVLKSYDEKEMFNISM